MKQGLFIICALAVVLGITTGALAGATAKQTSRFCVYVDHLDRGASHLDVSVDPKYGHQTCIVGKQGAKGAQGARVLRARRVTPEPSEPQALRARRVTPEPTELPARAESTHRSFTASRVLSVRIPEPVPTVGVVQVGRPIPSMPPTLSRCSPTGRTS